jgi:transcriptional/translational regulatory protein YebC/TACO1
MQALDAGAEDAQEEDGETVIYTEPQDFAKVRDSLKTSGLEISEAELTYVPNTTVTISDTDTTGKILRLMDALEEIEDVTNTHVNFEISQDIMTE